MRKLRIASSNETNEVINYLRKQKDVLEYIREDDYMDTGEDFLNAFENYLKII